jgi:hypothetical protein
MKLPFSSSFVAGALCAALLSAAAGMFSPQDPGKPKEQQSSAEQMAAMMQQAGKFTKPGKHHKELERFLGKWNTETRLTGSDKSEKGTSEYSWLMNGRWLKGENKGSLMGMPFQSFYLVGYDNFKQSFVTCAVNSMDTAMLHSEGDMDPGGKTLLSYGTLDEYLTGEVGKMVKYVWRFESADKFVIEVHDLPIGEHNTKVFEVIHTRG